MCAELMLFTMMPQNANAGLVNDLYNDPPQNLSSSKHPPSSHGIPPLSTLPSALSTTLFLAPTFVLYLITAVGFSKACSALHEGHLPLVLTLHPAMYARVAIDKTCR